MLQFHGRDGIIELGWGHPNPALLPVDPWAEACAAAVRSHGADALAYGSPRGPGPLVERLGPPAEVFVTAGASHALDLVCAALTRPGDTVLVESPTYHLALRILADHGVTLVAAPDDPAALADLAVRLRAPMLYCVPTFNNPTGASVPAERRTALVEVAARTGLAIVEDDTYRDLAYDGPAPPALRTLGGTGGPVVRIGSFSKSVAPGLRLGWVEAPAGVVTRLAERGFVDSGGGVNHTNALAMAWFLSSGAYARHVSAVRAVYRVQRDTLVAAVRRYLPEVSFEVPAGGWFLWLRLPSAVDSGELLARAEAAGVSYVDGRRFFVDGRGGEFVRLSFSMLGPDLLAEGARRLGTAVGQR